MPKSPPGSGASQEEYDRILKYVLVKARRYGIPTVRLSDVQTQTWQASQIKQLHADVAAAGFTLKLGRHTYGNDFQSAIAQRTAPPFGKGSDGKDRRNGQSRTPDYGYPPVK